MASYKLTIGLIRKGAALTMEVPAIAVITITVGVRHDSGVMGVTRGDTPLTAVSGPVPAEDVTPQKRRCTCSLVALSDTDRQLSQLRTQKNKTISDKCK